MDRRRFLKDTTAVSLAVGLSPVRAPEGGLLPSADQVDDLEKMLRRPPLDCRPMTRWWWYGGAVTEAEISRELMQMREAGIGGVEIQPVYPLAVDDPARGIINVPFFSDRWYELLAYAVSKGRNLGLRVELTLGSGWPFGGPFVRLDQAARRIRLLTREFDGPGHLRWNPSAGLGEGERIERVTARRLDRPAQDPASLLLAPNEVGRMANDGLALGPGRWRCYVAVNSPTYMQVKRPTLGMEGYVLDHFRRGPLELFLEATGQRTLDELSSRGAPLMDGFFCDSLEVYGADWTHDLPAEFRRRRGYDLEAFMHLLIETAGGLEERVRHDYHQTLSELTLENFFLPLAEWCRARGVPSRVQAHGAMGDILRAYGTVDVPEGETIFGGDVNRVNIRHRRLASSAAHLYGKATVSAETYTWLRMPMFLTNLEMMKAATDAAFLDGINQIVNHGYSYSPPEAGRPGWAFYASTHISPANTWWPHYHHLADYVRRCAAVLRQGDPVNRVGIYVPLADIFANKGTGGFHLDEAIEEKLGDELVAHLRRTGFDFDFLNDDALQRLARLDPSSSTALAIGQGRYQAVILPDVRTVPVEPLEVLVDFVAAGGHLLFYRRTPESVPGLANLETRQERLEAALTTLGARGSTSGSHGAGRWMKADHLEDLIKHLSEHLGADLVIRDAGEEPLDQAAREVGFVRRRLRESDLFFVSNISPTPKQLTVACGVGHRKPARLDPMTLERRNELVYRFERTSGGIEETLVEVDLDPFESCFLQFTQDRGPLIQSGRLPRSLTFAEEGGAVVLRGGLREAVDFTVTTGDGRTHRIQEDPGVRPVEVEGPWVLEIEGAAPVRLERLVSWTELPEFRGFSGWATCTAEFLLKGLDPGLRWFLHLGQVCDTAEAEINGRPVGDAWMEPRVLECTDVLREGRNRLTVRVANVWVHHQLEAPQPDYSELERSYGIRWGRYGEVPPEEVPPAGLLGPVRLVPEKEFSRRLV